MEAHAEGPIGQTLEQEVKPVNYVMDLIGPDGVPTRNLVQFSQIKHLGTGSMGSVYLAETTYTPTGVTLPKRVAVKVAGVGKDQYNRHAVKTLTKIRNAIKRSRPGMMVFPTVYAVDDRPGVNPYSYAMEIVDPEVYGGIYTARVNVNSLVTMLTVYSDAVDIMIDAGVAQNDRKVSDIIWFENGQRLKVLDWDAQISVGDRGGEPLVIRDEMVRVGKIVHNFLSMMRGPEGKFLTEEQTGDIAVLQKYLPQQVFDLVSLALRKELPNSRESLDEIKLNALMLREHIKDSARDLLIYQVTDLQNRLDDIRAFFNNQIVSNGLPQKLIEAAGRSKEEANREAIWEAARTEMAIHLKAREYLKSIKMWNPNEFDSELARILDKRAGHTITGQQVLSAIREKQGLEPIKAAPKISSFDPNLVDDEVLLHLYRIADERS